MCSVDGAHKREENAIHNESDIAIKFKSSSFITHAEANMYARSFRYCSMLLS